MMRLDLHHVHHVHYFVHFLVHYNFLYMVYATVGHIFVYLHVQAVMAKLDLYHVHYIHYFVQFQVNFLLPCNFLSKIYAEVLLDMFHGCVLHFAIA